MPIAVRYTPVNRPLVPYGLTASIFSMIFYLLIVLLPVHCNLLGRVRGPLQDWLHTTEPHQQCQHQRPWYH